MVISDPSPLLAKNRVKNGVNFNAVFYRKRLYAGTIPANKEYAAGIVPAKKKYAAGTVPANKKYAARRGYP